MDERGYDTFWMAEHHFQPEGTKLIPNGRTPINDRCYPKEGAAKAMHKVVAYAKCHVRWLMAEGRWTLRYDKFPICQSPLPEFSKESRPRRPRSVQRCQPANSVHTNRPNSGRISLRSGVGRWN